MNRPNIVIVITARLASRRLPGKVLINLGGHSALEIAVRRARQSGLPVIVTVPLNEPNLEAYVRGLPVDAISMGDPENVVSRIYQAAKPFSPSVIIRGLPDCPYFDYMSAKQRAEALLKYNIADATRSRHPYGREPIYGADEPAYSWRLVMHMLGVADDFEREHFGSYVDRHRPDVNILYTPSPSVDLYRDQYRPFRLELDVSEDVELLDQLMTQTGPLGSLSSAISILERCPDLARLNSHIQEQTGPVTSYLDYAEEFKLATQQTHEVDGGRFLIGLGRQYTPEFCSNGSCLIGYREADGYLRRITGEKIKGGELTCPCGAGRVWQYRPPSIDIVS